MGVTERFAARRRDRALLDVARGLERHGLVIGTVGNVSIRHGDRVRITPTATDYDRLAPRDLMTVDLAGRTRPPSGAAARPGRTTAREAGAARWAPGRAPVAARPSRELSMHLEIYRARPDVRAVVHAHGTYAAAWSFLGVPLAPAIEEIAYYGIGEVRVSPPAPAGSAELGRGAARALGPSASAALVGDHGLVAVGDSPARALLVARVVEHHAHIAWLLRADHPTGMSGVSDILTLQQ